jgi:hypothetical protein
VSGELAKQVVAMRKARPALLDLRGWVVLEKLAAWCKGTPPTCSTSIKLIRDNTGFNRNRIVAVLGGLEREKVLRRKRRYQEETLFILAVERLSESTGAYFHSGRESTSESTSESTTSVKETSLSHYTSADAAGAPSSAQAGRVEPTRSEILSGAARERSLSLAGPLPLAPAPDSGREGMSATADGGAPEARQPPSVQPTPPPPIRRMPMIDETPRDAAQLTADLLNGASETDVWRAKLHVWKQTGQWDAADGPKPFAPGCRVPADLLPRTTTVARKGPAPQPARTVMAGWTPLAKAVLAA